MSNCGMKGYDIGNEEAAGDAVDEANQVTRDDWRAVRAFFEQEDVEHFTELADLLKHYGSADGVLKAELILEVFEVFEVLADATVTIESIEP